MNCKCDFKPSVELELSMEFSKWQQSEGHRREESEGNRDHMPGRGEIKDRTTDQTVG